MTEPGEQGSGDWETGRWKMVSPGWGIPDRGWCVGPDGDGLLSGFYYSAKGPVSRILSCAVIPLDAASPRTFISDLPGGFGDCIDQPERAPRYARSSLTAPGRHRAAALLLAATSLPIWSCSVWGLPCPRHYCRSGALLPHLFTLTPALEIPQRRLYPASRGNTGIAVPGWPSSRIRRNGEG